MGKAIIIKGADFSQVAVASNTIPVTGLAITGASGSQTQRQVQLTVSYTPADTTQLGVVWSVVSGNATITDSGLLTYNGSAASASVVVKVTSTKNSSVYAQATVSFALPAVEAPAFTPVAGTYNEPQSVVISSGTAGVVIYYTTDGSTPTTASTRYTSPVQVNADMTIKAIAVKNGQYSDVSEASYVLELPARVTVNVTDGVNPITGATVVMEKGGTTFNPISSSGGSYVFDVSTATFNLSVTAEDYISYTEEFAVTGNMTKTVTLQAIPRTNMLEHATLYNGYNVYGDIANLYCSTGSAYAQRACVLVANEYCDGKTNTWRAQGNAMPGYSGPPVPDGATRIEVKMTNPNYAATVYAVKADRYCSSSSSFTLTSESPVIINPSSFTGLQNILLSFRPETGATWANTSISDLGLTCYAYYD